MSENLKQLHAVIQGRVHGVSFRYNTVLTANELGIHGWVRNVEDGTVEVLAEGTHAQLEQFLTFLRRGPVGARVVAVDLDWNTASGQFDRFEIRY